MFRNSTITDLFLFVFTQLILHYLYRLVFETCVTYFQNDTSSISNHFFSSKYFIFLFRDLQNKISVIYLTSKLLTG